MVIALEYTALFDENSPLVGAIETSNNLDSERGWFRSFNLGARRTVAVGQSEGNIKDVVERVEYFLRQYFLANLEPMPNSLFYDLVKTLFCFNGVKFVEKTDGTKKVMFLSDEVIGIM